MENVRKSKLLVGKPFYLLKGSRILTMRIIEAKGQLTMHSERNDQISRDNSKSANS